MAGAGSGPPSAIDVHQLVEISSAGGRLTVPRQWRSTPPVPARARSWMASRRLGVRRLGGVTNGSLREARRGQLDRALSGARHRARVQRGLDRRPSSTSSSARRSSSERGSTSAASRSCPATGASSPRSSPRRTPRSSSRGTSTGEIHAFHNICRHRGNKLVWNDFPSEETRGNCRQFTCKYHGWRYDLDGALTFVPQEDEFFDLDKADLRPRPGPLRRLGRLHLRQLADEPEQSAARLPRADGPRSSTATPSTR